MGGDDMGVAVGNFQQISYITQISYIGQMEQHSPFRLTLLHLGNVCSCVCM